MDLDEVDIPAPDDGLLLQVNEVLAELETDDPGKANIVKLRFFGGLSNEETAALLGVSEKTVRRHWTFAKAWLTQRLQAK